MKAIHDDPTTKPHRRRDESTGKADQAKKARRQHIHTGRQEFHAQLLRGHGIP